MGDRSAIQWTDATWNPWHGCAKVSEGCDLCYMFREKKAYGQDPLKVVRSKTKFNEPLKWAEPRRVFTCSWSDFFIADADAWRDEAWAIIKATPQHTYQILTKRPARIVKHLPADWGEGYENVWLGVSVENQAWANRRIPLLLATPAQTRFISAEPLLGEVNLMAVAGTHPWHCLSRGIDYDEPAARIDWVIVGGESGGRNEARPFDPAWARLLRKQCHEFGTAFFLKQLGRNVVGLTLTDSHGGDMDEWPEDLRVREFPVGSGKETSK